MIDLKELGDSFYDIRTILTETESGVWIGRGLVIRKDTNETVGGTQIRSGDAGETLRLLSESLKPIVSALARPPHEWGMTSVRSILMTYKRFNDELTSAYVHLEHRRALGSLSKDELHRTHHMVRDMVRRQTLELVERLERLTEAERLQLVTSAEEVYQHIHDPWNLDDVYARDAIFDYLLRPSAELIRRHEAHQARMVSEFEKGSTEH